MNFEPASSFVQSQFHILQHNLVQNALTADGLATPSTPLARADEAIARLSGND
jgi:hypothetical protein